MDKFVYPSLKARLKTEYKIYIAAVIFILIADSIGQIQIPLGPGQFILFPSWDRGSSSCSRSSTR